MSLFKRGSTWWIDFTTPSGERIRCTANTEEKSQAQELHDKMKFDAWRVSKLGEKPKHTWDEAALKWLSETQHKATHEGDKSQLRWLQQYLRGRLLENIDRELIATIGEAKAKQSSSSTANRHLALIRAILRKAVYEWEWIDKAPRVKLYREAKRRIRWITPEVAKQLLAELPEHQRNVVLFALATGLRQANVMKLEWSQVDAERGTAWIHADQAKGRRDIHVSLNSVALGVLQAQAGKHPSRVFTYRGRPINQANTKAWKGALKRAEIQNFRWHDLRHTWATWHRQSGTPTHELQRLGGRQSLVMVERYAHLASEHLASAANRLDAVFQESSYVAATPEKLRA